ncbi:hypothetical protein VNO78_21438 [Psophocarpus tetragonolobus]|uniref:Uncharacterized protein n=1 Tax=Psophocarpus tetragonolobus TaxID=3891 RepID=A0AAN9SFB3_PSOTE
MNVLAVPIACVQDKDSEIMRLEIQTVVNAIPPRTPLCLKGLISESTTHGTALPFQVSHVAAVLTLRNWLIFGIVQPNDLSQLFQGSLVAALSALEAFLRYIST